jgi:hypothetical protein
MILVVIEILVSGRLDAVNPVSVKGITRCSSVVRLMSPTSC